jgi:hypothetical protein
MSLFNRPLADSLIQTLPQSPVLSVVIPTFHRPIEMAFAVNSIAAQVTGDLVGKVEIIISDNNSGPESYAAIKQLAETYPFVSYYIHAADYGGPYQICSAPHRARGEWTWVFGDDDALGEGGLEAIVDVLEKERPDFLTINRQVWNKTLDALTSGTKHKLPDVRFDTFVDLLAMFGWDQLSFLTSQVYATEVARAVDPAPYLESLCRFAQLAYYLDGFHDRTAYYLSAPVVWHRWDQGATETHMHNFRDLATSHPALVQQVADRVGIAPGLFERIEGRRSIAGAAARKITFVDNILENLWRSVGLGAEIAADQWDGLAALSADWAPGRAADLAQVREMHDKLGHAFRQYQIVLADYRAQTGEGRAFTPAEVEVLQKSRTAILSLQDNINAARRMAFSQAAGFS